MQDILAGTERVNKEQLDQILDAVLRRHKELYPEWEWNVFALEKQKDRNSQIEETIAFLRKMKEEASG